MKPTVFFKRIHPDAKMPVYATPGSSGMDVFSVDDAAWFGFNDLSLEPGERAAISTGLQAEIPPGFEIQVRAKSGRAFKEGLTVLNGPGTVDADYRGEIKVLVINLGHEPVYIKKGEKIAQLVVVPVEQAIVRETAGELSATVRGDGGFGSTGL
jgi:dUTP pyrophosphatase